MQIPMVDNQPTKCKESHRTTKDQFPFHMEHLVAPTTTIQKMFLHKQLFLEHMNVKLNFIYVR